MPLERVLVVEDEAPLREAMVRVVARRGTEIVEAASLAEALERLADATPDLIVLDVRLPDGSGVELAEVAARIRPRPTLIAVTGEATSREAFELGQAGVAHLLPKPFTLEQLQTTVDAARAWVPELEPFVAASVGKRELLDLVAIVRGTMVEEALAKSEGSRRGAARRLGISRQAIQQLLRKHRGRDPEVGPEPRKAVGEEG